MEMYLFVGNCVYLCLGNSLFEVVVIGDVMKIFLCWRIVLYLLINWVSFIKRLKLNMV